MSGFENYQQQFDELDARIASYVAICALPVEKPLGRSDIETLLHQHLARDEPQPARQTLEALLVLRIQLETEMFEEGLQPPELSIRPCWAVDVPQKHQPS